MSNTKTPRPDDCITVEPEPTTDDLLRRLVAGRDARPADPAVANGPLVGILVAIRGSDDQPLVTYSGHAGSAAMAARSAVRLDREHLGKEVVIVFEHCDAARPIVIGVLQSQDSGATATGGTMEVEADGERMLISAKDRLVLRCGKSSITLTKEGKVVIEGAYVATSASGVNRIKGGSVQIN